MENPKHALPPRFSLPSAGLSVIYLVALCVIVIAFEGAGISFRQVQEGLPYMVQSLREAFPPDFSGFDVILVKLWETFLIAVAGTVMGIIVSLPLSTLASKNQSPHPTVYYVVRSAISLMRTTPEIIWAMLFVILVGLGPFAGALAIMVDTIGFCGRFFAEGIEEAEKGPQEALSALGASKVGILCSAVVPLALPSLINTSLYNLEKAVRASVVLGLVGAGGIGMEMKYAMQFFLYDRALAIILSVFALVFLVEQVSSRLRAKII